MTILAIFFSIGKVETIFTLLWRKKTLFAPNIKRTTEVNIRFPFHT